MISARVVNLITQMHRGSEFMARMFSSIQYQISQHESASDKFKLNEERLRDGQDQDSRWTVISLVCLTLHRRVADGRCHSGCVCT